jgi:hypothetical protein
MNGPGAEASTLSPARFASTPKGTEKSIATTESGRQVG